MYDLYDLYHTRLRTRSTPSLKLASSLSASTTRTHGPNAHSQRSRMQCNTFVPATMLRTWWRSWCRATATLSQSRTIEGNAHTAGKGTRNPVLLRASLRAGEAMFHVVPALLACLHSSTTYSPRLLAFCPSLPGDQTSFGPPFPLCSLACVLLLLTQGAASV